MIHLNGQHSSSLYTLFFTQKPKLYPENLISRSHALDETDNNLPLSPTSSLSLSVLFLSSLSIAFLLVSIAIPVDKTKTAVSFLFRTSSRPRFSLGDKSWGECDRGVKWPHQRFKLKDNGPTSSYKNVGCVGRLGRFFGLFLSRGDIKEQCVYSGTLLYSYL